MAKSATLGLALGGLALSGLGFAISAPEKILSAEFARQRWLAGAQVFETRVAQHRWAYLQAGETNKPLLVLVHGFTGAKENWLPLMRVLASDYFVIAPDLPGWGESERLDDADYGPIAQADRLSAFIRSLPKKPELLVGHSMGGQIAGLLAAREPEISTHLFLMSAAGVRFKENAFGLAVLAGENPFQVSTRAELQRYLGIVFAEPPFVPWPVDNALVQRRRNDAAFEQHVLDGIGRGPQALALQALLPDIKAPTLLLWCRDDQVIDVSAQALFAEGLARSQSVLLAGCGHMPMMAQPTNVATAMTAFLQRKH